MRLLSFLFFLSGFSGLLLEVIWARQLSLLFGNGVRCAGAVAALTLAGLALGSRWAGRRADRAARPLRTYALLEAGIALWALGTPFLFRALSVLTASLPERWGGDIDLGPGALLGTTLLLLPGAFLMGATTPFVVCAARPDGASTGREVATGGLLGKLYGWNTAGGAAGALLSVFLILPSLGVGRASLFCAGVEMSVALAAAALSLGRRHGSRKAGIFSPEPEPSAAGALGRRSRLPVLAVLFLAGAAAAGCQVAWTRVLVLLFGSSAYAFGLVLFVYLAGLAAGSSWSGRLLGRGTPAARVTTVALLIAAVSTLLSLPAWGRLPLLVSLALERTPPSFTSVLLLQSILSLGLLLLPTMALGALLPALTAELRGGAGRTGRDAGDGYSFDTWGSVVGCLATSFLFLPRLGVESILRGAVLLEAGLLGLFLWTSPGRLLPVASRRLAAAALPLLLGVTLLLPGWDSDLMTSGPLLYAQAYAGGATRSVAEMERAIRRRGSIRFLEEGPESTVTVREGAGGILSLQINGKTDASTGGDLPTQLLAGHLPALLHPSPRTALVIGLASGVTAAAVALHPVEKIDCVEISPGVARAARLFSTANRSVLSDSRFRLFLGDGRALLNRTSGRYDLIASQPTNPWISGVTNLFTREFFRLARRRLAPGGVLCVWVQGYALDPDDFRAILRSFREVFPDALLWEESPAGGDYFLLGRNGGSWPTPERLAEKIEGPQPLREDLARAGIEDVAQLLGRFVTGAPGLAELSRGVSPVTDDNLRLEFRAPRSLWEDHLPDLTAELERARESPLDRLPPDSRGGGDVLRSRLAEVEERRRDRIRLALSLRRADRLALASPQFSAAVGLVRAGLEDAALPFLRRARTEAPRSPAVPLLLGWLLLGRADLEGARRAFDEAASLDPGSADAVNGLGLVAWRRQDLAAARELFLRSARLSHSDPNPLNNLASVLLASGREADALPLLERIIRENPGYVPARINRGVALARRGRLAEAVRDYLRALELDPLNADAAYNLKVARERQDRIER